MGKGKGENRRVVIIGATSGIGRKLAEMYLDRGHIVGVAGRRTDELVALAGQWPGRVHYRTMDVTDPGCAEIFDDLIAEMGGVDLLVYSSGVGTQNPPLEPAVEMNTVGVNVDGFSRIVIRGYNYFKTRPQGQIAVISSLAGIRPLRQSPAYSATKRYQMHYVSCLAQKAHHEKLPLKFTTIIPGFIRTDMLKHKYPLTTSLEKGASLIFRAIERRARYATVPGWWCPIKFLWRLIPSFIWERM